MTLHRTGTILQRQLEGGRLTSTVTPILIAGAEKARVEGIACLKRREELRRALDMEGRFKYSTPWSAVS